MVSQSIEPMAAIAPPPSTENCLDELLAFRTTLAEFTKLFSFVLDKGIKVSMMRPACRLAPTLPHAGHVGLDCGQGREAALLQTLPKRPPRMLGKPVRRTALSAFHAAAAQ